MTGLNDIAPILLRAAARSRIAQGSTFVVKLGGSAMEEPVATRGTLDSIALLNQLGLKMVLVHGGGKPIDRAMAGAGLSPRKVAGRRYTDDATLEIVVRVLDLIGESISNELIRRGVDAAMHRPIRAERLKLIGEDGRPVDLGHVGAPTEVDQALLWNVMECGAIPVIPSLGIGTTGLLNINADTAAAAIAGEFKAEAAIFLTDTPGVLANRDDPTSLYARLTVGECRKLIADGTIAGGMIPKVEACFEALDAGAQRAVVLDGRNPYALLGEFLTDIPAGTAITRE